MITSQCDDHNFKTALVWNCLIEHQSLLWACGRAALFLCNLYQKCVGALASQEHSHSLDTHSTCMNVDEQTTSCCISIIAELKIGDWETSLWQKRNAGYFHVAAMDLTTESEIGKPWKQPKHTAIWQHFPQRSDNSHFLLWLWAESHSQLKKGKNAWMNQFEFFSIRKVHQNVTTHAFTLHFSNESEGSKWNCDCALTLFLKQNPRGDSFSIVWVRGFSAFLQLQWDGSARKNTVKKVILISMHLLIGGF